MNIQLLMQMLMGQQRRVPMDEQAPMGIQNFSKIDPEFSLPLYSEDYPTQPRYRPDRRINDMMNLNELYYTNPRNGVMPRRTRLGVEEGYRSDDLEWIMRSLGKY